MFLASSSSTSTSVFWVLSAGDLIAIAVALLANLVTVYVTWKDRKTHDASEKRAEEWRRAQAKYDRIHAHFAGIVRAANTLEAMVGLFQWKADKHKSEQELAQYKEILDKIMDTFADAVANLTVEGMTEQADAINKMVNRFFDFRRRLYLMGEHEEDTQDNFDQMFDDSEAIKAARIKLEEDLPAIRKKLLPEKIA
jgi:hypothetical protein